MQVLEIAEFLCLDEPFYTAFLSNLESFDSYLDLLQLCRPEVQFQLAHAESSSFYDKIASLPVQAYANHLDALSGYPYSQEALANATLRHVADRLNDTPTKPPMEAYARAALANAALGDTHLHAFLRTIHPTLVMKPLYYYLRTTVPSRRALFDKLIQHASSVFITGLCMWDDLHADISVAQMGMVLARLEVPGFLRWGMLARWAFGKDGTLSQDEAAERLLAATQRVAIPSRTWAGWRKALFPNLTSRRLERVLVARMTAQRSAL